MSDMTSLLDDLSYIPPNNEHNEPTQEDIGETSNEPTQATRNEFEELYSSANEAPGLDGEMSYGQLQEILEFKYLSFKVALFRVKWFDTRNNGRVKKLTFRNGMTQIIGSGEWWKNDQYILATQVKQVFYLEDPAKPNVKVVEHVNHKKFFNRGVIVVENEPDIIHLDNSSDLPPSTSGNDLDNVTFYIDLHIDGESTEVDAPPDIIDVPGEDDDISDDEDPLPHDLADSDVEDLINDDDGVEKMADVARAHGGDGGGEDPSRPPPTSFGCAGCFINRGKGKRKPNLGGVKAGRKTRERTRNQVLKDAVAANKGRPIEIGFEDRADNTVKQGRPPQEEPSEIDTILKSFAHCYGVFPKIPEASPDDEELERRVTRHHCRNSTDVPEAEKPSRPPFLRGSLYCQITSALAELFRTTVDRSNDVRFPNDDLMRSDDRFARIFCSVMIQWCQKPGVAGVRSL
ncbi:hypothetical protein Tco_0625295 [Tanacetum coccineum]|uniref:DUF4216 domain-containing protein n=1 Tax=Tanacetum coccineum TaxID=301880 RepID=A0ABQ4WGC9_9ASTR